mmetsp:Transcript_19703/g.27020  ORF Transcript_19703/g.27020 Transcript_19703/m.27020 type:complete len:802 (-) Transcript_19703:124-2529(-)
MRTVVEQMSGNTEKLQTVWQDKLDDVYKALSTGNESKIGVLMDDLQFDSADIITSDEVNDEMSAQLQFIKQQLLKVLEFREVDREKYERESTELLEGLRSVQIQLTRTEEKIGSIEKEFTKLFSMVDKGVMQIRDDLKKDHVKIKELRDAWDIRLSRIEEAVEKGNVKLLSRAVDYLKNGNDNFARNLESSLRDAMNKQFDVMKVKLSESNKIDQQQVLAELRSMQAQLAEVLVLTKDSRARLEAGLQMLRRTVVNINQRICPTVFIVLPRDFEDKEPLMEKKAGSASVERVKKIYSFVTDSSARQDMLVDLLNEKEYLALVCELCHQPQRPAIELTKPKEIVGKILPLAKVGLKFVCNLSTASRMGRMFGFPTLVLPSKAVNQTKDFLESVGKSSLDDFEELQKRAKRDYGGEETKERAGGDGSKTFEEQDISEGYCAREFRHFLKEVDPKDEWCGLSAKVTDDGYVFFICKECYIKQNGNQPQGARGLKSVRDQAKRVDGEVDSCLMGKGQPAEGNAVIAPWNKDDLLEMTPRVGIPSDKIEAMKADVNYLERMICQDWIRELHDSVVKLDWISSTRSPMKSDVEAALHREFLRMDPSLLRINFRFPFRQFDDLFIDFGLLPRDFDRKVQERREIWEILDRAGLKCLETDIVVDVHAKDVYQVSAHCEGEYKDLTEEQILSLKSQIYDDLRKLVSVETFQYSNVAGNGPPDTTNEFISVDPSNIMIRRGSARSIYVEMYLPVFIVAAVALIFQPQLARLERIHCGPFKSELEIRREAPVSHFVKILISAESILVGDEIV